VAGLLLFKPQLGAVVAIVLSFSAGWRAAAGALATFAVLMLITVIALPGSLTGYFHQLPANLRAIQILPIYTWARHVTFLAWWRILLQGHIGSLPTPLTSLLAGACMTVVGLFLARTLWQAPRDGCRTDRLIAAAIAAGPLLMPYYMDYDLTLLAVAAALCAAEAIRNGVDRNVLAAWVAFYVIAELNPSIAGNTRVIPDVPLLAVLACVLIHKANRPLAEIELQPIFESRIRATTEALPVAA